MMILDCRTQSIEHSEFAHLPDVLQKDSLLILNNSRVIPARLFGRRQTGAKLEILLVREKTPSVWQCRVKNSSKIKIGECLELCDGNLQAELLEKKDDGDCSLKFSYENDFYGLLERQGYAPIPPYIARTRSEEVPRKRDLAQYQTIYAKQYGAIAAPTAGLHFTEEVLDRIAHKDIGIVEITLHVGLGTFEPIRADNIEQHRMHSERYLISRKNAETIDDAIKQKRKIVAVGTTSARALEASWKEGRIRPGNRSTDLFIYPPYRFRVVDRLLTNFHLPESTLLMLVSALAGRDFIMEAYRQAIREKYRFYSFGDCMLIGRS